MIRGAVLLLIGVMAVSVQTADALSWKRLDKTVVVSGDKKFSVELPVGWVQAIDSDKEVVATRDGLGIQVIGAVRTLHKDAFEKLRTKEQKKKNAMKTPKNQTMMVNADMLPSEVAELVIAEFKSGSEMSHVRIVSNTPRLIDGMAGFQIHFQYKNPKGLLFDHIVSGFVDDKNLYRFFYRAPSRIFFPRDLEVFDHAVASFKRVVKQ